MEEPDTASTAAAGPSAPPVTSSITHVVTSRKSPCGSSAGGGSSAVTSPLLSTLSSQAHSPAQSTHHVAGLESSAAGVATRNHRSRPIQRTPGTAREGADASVTLYAGAPGSSLTSSSATSGSGADCISVSGAAVSAGRSTFGVSGALGGGGAGRRKDKHQAALDSIRRFLRGRSSYDVLPVSFRLVVLDTKLVVKPALDVMWQAGVVSAPLWQSTPATDIAHTGAEAETGAGADSHQHDGAEAADALQAVSAAQPADDTNSSRPVSPETQVPVGNGAFAGMLTVNDIIHLIQYYYMNSSYGDAAKDVETFRLEKLKDIERSLQVPQPPTLSVHPLRSLYEACQIIIRTHARRLPLIDHDEQTGIETVLSVLTQYRVLKFIAMNCRETAILHRSIRSLGIGTYVGAAPSRLSDQPHIVAPQNASLDEAAGASTTQCTEQSLKSSRAAELAEEQELKTPVAEKPLFLPALTPSTAVPGQGETSKASPQARGSILASVLSPSNSYAPLATATLDTTVFDVVHMFSELGISAVPVLDEDGNVVDLYESVDVVTLVRTGAYQALDLTIRQALARRPPDFPGIMVCSPDDSLANIFALLRRRRVHRLVILAPETAQQPQLQPEHQQPKAAGLDAEMPAHAESAAETSGTDAQQTAGGTSANSGSGSGLAAAGQTGTAQLPTPPPPPPMQQQQQLGPVPTTPRELESELEAGIVRKRRKGKLVGILCLSDILKHVIGDLAEQQHQQALLQQQQQPHNHHGGGREGAGRLRGHDRLGSEGSTGTPYTTGTGTGTGASLAGSLDASPSALVTAGIGTGASLADVAIPEGRVLESPLTLPPPPPLPLSAWQGAQGGAVAAGRAATETEGAAAATAAPEHDTDARKSQRGQGQELELEQTEEPVAPLSLRPSSLADDTTPTVEQPEMYGSEHAINRQAQQSEEQ